ncbi:hypothetical protein N0V94_006698 [Neodidymelliopsis sp. IMI 364377]|nr:hypothetical protein N0V94_006698 [Neodidymelliopsis sp. IMI 364377]
MTARNEQARIYPRTRRVMHVQTSRTYAVGLRDYGRENHVPTKRTQPALLTRRYSVDVNTKDWDKPYDSGWTKTAVAPASPHERKNEELDCATLTTPDLPFPSPHRYTGFNKWMSRNPPDDNGNYLQLDTASISNEVFWYYTHTSGSEKWMRDDGLDMALMVLSKEKNCDASNIGIASSVDSQVCAFPDDTGKEEYVARFGNKRWIFMPINDGMAGVENDGINGVHWSFLVLDRIHSQMHYFDSLFVSSHSYQDLAIRVSAGMLRILGEEVARWNPVWEFTSPHQWRDNNCTFDGGPCAPFVYQMIDTIIGRIQTHQQLDDEDGCYLNLPFDYPYTFSQWWDSYNTRTTMQERIAVMKAISDARRLTSMHDRAATANEDVILLDEPDLRFDVPHRPAESVQPTDSDSDSESDTMSVVSIASDKSTPAVGIVLAPLINLPYIISLEATGPNKEEHSTHINVDERSGKIEDIVTSPTEWEEGGVPLPMAIVDLPANITADAGHASEPTMDQGDCETDTEMII